MVFIQLFRFFFFFSMLLLQQSSQYFSLFLQLLFFLDHFNSLFFFTFQNETQVMNSEAKNSYKPLKFIHKICTQKLHPHQADYTKESVQHVS